jgi:hypothetical protein
MKKHNKPLERYFEAARAQQLPVPLQDIKSELAHISHQGTTGSTGTSQRFSFARTTAVWIGLLVTLSVLATGTWLLLHNPTLHQEKEAFNVQPNALPSRPAAVSPVEKNPGKLTKAAPAKEAPTVSTPLKRVPSTSLKGLITTSAKKAGLAPVQLIEPFKFLELPPDALDRLGIEVKPDGVYYNFFVNASQTNEKPDMYRLHFARNLNEVYIYSDSTRAVAFSSDAARGSIQPLFFSDRQGTSHPFSYRGPTDDPRKLEPAYFQEVVNSLIPVLVTAPNADRYQLVFWFTPSPAFLRELPQHLAQEIAEEYQLLLEKQPGKVESRKVLHRPGTRVKLGTALTTGEEGPPAKETYQYFEAARSSISSARQLKLYPNPAQDKVNLSLTLEQPHELRISLTDISGKVIKVLTPMQTFGSGVLTQNYSIRHLPAGIYVLVIESESGEKQTQRLIIQQSDGVTD